MMKVIFLAVLTIITVYFVIGGITEIIIQEKVEFIDENSDFETDKFVIDNTEYPSKSHYVIYKEYENVQSVYPHIKILKSDSIVYLINLIFFGVLGSIIRILLLYQDPEVDPKKIRVYTTPILGGLIGLVVIIASQLLPEFKYNSGNMKFYYNVALLAGLYSREFFNNLKGVAWDRLFKHKNG